MTTKNKIVITGGDGRFAKILRSHNKIHDIYYPSKKLLDILDILSIKNYLKKIMNTQ